MRATRAILQKLLETATGVDVEMHGSGVALIPRRRRKGAWFSLRAQLRSLLQDLKIDAVLDVGANEGQFAQRLRRGGFRGDLHSFEPVRSVYERLRSTAQGDRAWHVHNMALGRQRGEQHIFVAANPVFSSLLPTTAYASEHFGSESVGRATEIVRVERLEAFLDERAEAFRDRRLLLKMDTQGFDQEVFAGAGEWLRNVDLLLSEIPLLHLYEGVPHWTECVAEFERAGFAVSGLFPVNRDHGAVVEFDCLMVRRPRG